MGLDGSQPEGRLLSRAGDGRSPRAAQEFAWDLETLHLRSAFALPLTSLPALPFILPFLCPTFGELKRQGHSPTQP